MIFKDSKELLQFMRSCAKIGVKEFKSETFSFTLSGEAKPEKSPSQGDADSLKPMHVSASQSSAADAIAEDAQKKEQRQIEEDDEATLLVEHPEEFEEQAIKEIQDGPEYQDALDE